MRCQTNPLEQTAPTNGRRGSGYTVVEVLVALFVIGVLLALIVPAVLRSRESSRLVQCQNNLRQIGIACHAFEASVRNFPPGNYRKHSFLTALLPHLDQQNVFARIDFQNCWLTNLDQFALLSSLGPQVFHCPSDLNDLRQLTDYLGNCGTEGLGTPNGVITNQPVRIADLQRGLSNAVAVSEVHDWSEAAVLETPFQDTSGWRRYVDACRNAGPDVMQQSWSHVWFRPSRPDTLYNHVLTPNGRDCVSTAGPSHQQSIVLTARSRHSGGVNVLMADGSTRFVSEHVDEHLWVTMGSRNGTSWLQD